MAYDPGLTEPPHILVVEDDLHVVQGLIAGLRREGFALDVAMDGTDACARAVDPRYDLVVLDLMLPGASGFDVLRAMSGRTSTPVLVLSARTEKDARLEAFQLGAVDFVAKPFWIEELVARIRLRLGLTGAPPGARTLQVGSTTVDLDARTVLRDGEDLGFTPIEFNILAWLAERPGKAVRRSELAAHALGTFAASDRTVDSHVSRVRKKLGDDGDHLKTVWGIGYRYEPA